MLAVIVALSVGMCKQIILFVNLTYIFIVLFFIALLIVGLVNTDSATTFLVVVITALPSLGLYGGFKYKREDLPLINV